MCSSDLHDPVIEVLARLISTVIKEFPQQTLWLFASVVKSRNKTRESRGRNILERLQVRFFVHALVFYVY